MLKTRGIWILNLLFDIPIVVMAFFNETGFKLAIPLAYLAVGTMALLFFVEYVRNTIGINNDIKRVEAVSALNKCVDAQTQVNKDVVLA